MEPLTLMNFPAKSKTLNGSFHPGCQFSTICRPGPGKRSWANANFPGKKCTKYDKSSINSSGQSGGRSIADLKKTTVEVARERRRCLLNLSFVRNCRRRIRDFVGAYRSVLFYRLFAVRRYAFYGCQGLCTGYRRSGVYLSLWDPCP